MKNSETEKKEKKNKVNLDGELKGRYIGCRNTYEGS